MTVNLKNPRAPLKEVWEHQLGYIERVSKLGYVPRIQQEYDLDDRGHQAFIRELGGFLCEELAEMTEQIHMALEAEEVDPEVLRAYNEEAADAVCLFIELLVFSNLERTDVLYALNPILENLGVMRASECPLVLGLQAGTAYFNSEVGNNESWRLSARILSAEVGDYHFDGLKEIGPHQMKVLADMSSSIHYNIFKAFNFLKNKPWRIKDRQTNVPEYQSHILKAFIDFMGALAVLGHRGTQLARQTIEKIQINHNRLDEDREN